MEPISPNLRELWKSYGVTDEDINEYDKLLACRMSAEDAKTRDLYAEKIKNCNLCKQSFFAGQQ